MVEDGVVGAYGRYGGCAEGVILQFLFTTFEKDEGVLCDVGDVGRWDDVC